MGKIVFLNNQSKKEWLLDQFKEEAGEEAKKLLSKKDKRDRVAWSTALVVSLLNDGEVK